MPIRKLFVVHFRSRINDVWTAFNFWFNFFNSKINMCWWRGLPLISGITNTFWDSPQKRTIRFYQIELSFRREWSRHKRLILVGLYLNPEFTTIQLKMNFIPKLIHMWHQKQNRYLPRQSVHMTKIWSILKE